MPDDETEVRLDRLASAGDNKGRWEVGPVPNDSEYMTQEEVLAHLERMKGEVDAISQSTPGGMMRCIDGEYMLYVPYSRALVPGHIYSEQGMREARISRCCEYHFDKMFDEEWVDALTGEPGDMNPDRAEWLALNQKSAH